MPFIFLFHFELEEAKKPHKNIIDRGDSLFKG